MPTVASVEVCPDLGHWSDAWDELVLGQELPSPFQRSWWLAAVAPTGTTYLLVHDGEVLLGGLALGVRRRLGVTRYVAPGPTVLCPDHLDALARAGQAEVVVAALAAWFHGPGQRIADIRGVVEDSLLSRALGGRAEPSDVAPYQPLTADGYLSSRSSNFRRSVRRGRRRLADAGYEHRRVSPEDVPAALAAFARLHDSRDGREALLAELDPMSAAVVAGVAHDEARVDVVSSETEVVAVSLAFVLAGRLSLYQVARSTAPDHDSAGTVLLAEVIEDAAVGGLDEVDLLRGAEGYKQSFSDHTRPVLRLRSAHGAWAGAQLRAEDLARRINARLRSRVP